MHRRLLIKNMMIVGGVLVLSPGCVSNEKKFPVPLKKIAINSNEEMLLAEVVETILPATDTPGAKDLQIHHFVLTMIDDCYIKEDQLKFMQGLKAFDSHLKKTTGKYLANTSADARPAVFADLVSATSSQKDILYFLLATKQLTVLGYTQSKYVMTKLIPYELVPGRFHGCVKVNTKA